MSEYENEVNKCPECEGDIAAVSPEFTGDGCMFRIIGCVDCHWGAIEEWELQSTEERE